MKALPPLVGHEGIRRSLIQAHAAGGIPASLLLHGLRGVGKQRLALWAVQLQFCASPTDAGPCEHCRPCRMAGALEHPDLHWYFPLLRPKGVSGDRLADALEVARIDALEDFRANPIQPSKGDELRGLYLGLIQRLRRKAQVHPTMAPMQVFIVADAEYLVPQESSPEAANALLKLLEEPPSGTRFILTSGEPGRLLPTIRSRTVPLHLAPLPLPQVQAFLEEHGGVDGKTAAWAAGMSQGSIGRALGFLPAENEPGPQEGMRLEARAILEAALSDGRSAGFTLALKRPPARARSMIELFAFVEEWLRDLAAVASGAEERVHSQDSLPFLRDRASKRRVDPSAAAAALPALEEARELARGNVNPQLIVSGLVRRLRKALRPPPVRSGSR